VKDPAKNLKRVAMMVDLRARYPWPVELSPINDSSRRPGVPCFFCGSIAFFWLRDTEMGLGLAYCCSDCGKEYIDA
jgi:hypothetical protein